MRRTLTTLVLAICLTGLWNGSLTAQQPEANQNGPQRRFIVTLALGDLQPGKSGEFTAGAAKALGDMKNFLPYKSYRPLDTLYLFGLDDLHRQLKGLVGRQYDFVMSGDVVSPVEVKVRGLRLWSVKMKDEQGLPSTLLIESSFNLHISETIVVGTSRLEGDLALLLLVNWVR